jgi:serine/threonine protein kinase
VAQVLTISRQVALGVYYLHCCTPPVLHLDLKSANVLLDAHGIAKVCDFGLAHLKLAQDGVTTQRMGSPMWTAPEVLKGEARDETADSYSFGMLLYELMTRQLPYGEHGAAQVMMGVITNLLPRPELLPDHEYPEAIVGLMQQCWQFEAPKRPMFAAVLDVLETAASDAGLPFAGT